MIYCVEDGDDIRELMLYTLKTTGFEAKGFENGEAFWEVIEEELPSLVLLDIMLPGDSGLTILKKLRSQKKTQKIPVIMATAKGTEFDKVTGLDLGADDYLVKPFGMMEMVSRIKAVLRRTSEEKPTTTFQTENLLVDLDRHLVKEGTRRIDLTLKEFNLLTLLLRHPGRVFTRQDILSAVWGECFLGESRTVDVHVGSLRTKLGESGSLIKTVRGLGYCLETNHD